MNKKAFLLIVFGLVFILASNAYAASQNGGNGIAEPAIQQTQVDQQTQTASQGEADQIQAQNGEQVQAGPGDQAQEQDRERLQDGSGAGNQTQNQNQGEESRVKAQEKSGAANGNKGGSAAAQERRSQVASAVQAMLQVADRNGGIGEQVRTIAQTQTRNQEKLEVSLEKVQSRNALAKFFFGPNYGEAKKAEKLLEQNREQIQELNQIKSQLINQGDDLTIMEQIRILEQANLQIENSLGTAQKGFSLFGWLNRLLS